MKIAEINNTQTNISNKALIISPSPKYWDKKVLNAALDSRAVKKVISQSESLGKNCIMEFESFVGRYVNSMHFNLYSGNSKSIALKSGPCENNLENNVKPEKLGDCLANKIKELDEKIYAILNSED